MASKIAHPSPLALHPLTFPKDLLLPRTLVSRLSRGSLPPNTSLQKDALLALTKSATVFISYLAHTANNLTSRKTIQAADVLEAIREIELQGIMGTRLEEEIQLFEEGVKGKRKGYRDRVKAREWTGTNAAGGQDEGGEEGEEKEEDDRGPPQSKKVRRTDDGDGDVEMDGNTSNAGLGHEHADPSAQLEAEAARAGANVEASRPGNEQIESDPDAPIDEDEDEVEDEEEEQEQEDEEDDAEEEEDEEDDDEEEQGNEDGENLDVDMDEEERSRRKKGEMLAPNGRVEIGSEDESD